MSPLRTAYDRLSLSNRQYKNGSINALFGNVFSKRVCYARFSLAFLSRGTHESRPLPWRSLMPSGSCSAPPTSKPWPPRSVPRPQYRDR